jgi:hypothetical protein
MTWSLHHVVVAPALTKSKTSKKKKKKPDMPDTPAPLTFWLTDRTRSKTGLGRCMRKRYLSTAFGPTGYGITARSESLPLTTGLAVHEGLEALCLILQKEDRLSTAEETRAIAEAAKARYRAKVEARGFSGILGGPTTDETIAEQSVLIAGLIWVLRKNFLQWLHEGYRVIAVEQERLHFLSCTCGAGPLDPAEHVRRGCQGKVLMIRTDILAQRRGASTLAYFEGKTTGWESDAWAEQWETDPQLALGTLDTEKIYGQEVTELYIVGIGKGRRAKDRYEGATDERKKQQSPLCYGYCRPGNPPLASDDWVWSYEWVDADGATRRKTKAHRRRGVWELPQSDWPTWLAYHGQDPDMPPEEFWVRMLPKSILDKVCFLLGPMNRQDAQLASLRTSMIADEERWQEILWTLYEAQQGNAYPWGTPEFQALLDRLVPCSWQCRPYGKEHQCEFVRICHRYEGWQDPIGGGHFVPRRPHHAVELQQAIARGLLVEQTEEVDEDEGR